MSFELNLAKENFKFSGTHFTVLGPGISERLHGHNYYVQVKVRLDNLDPVLGMAFDFNELKPVVRGLCEELDEHVLLPQKSPHLKIRKTGRQIEIDFADKHYSFPQEDVRELPLVNITSEELARHLALRISEKTSGMNFNELTVQVEETRGQGAAFTLSLHR